LVVDSEFDDWNGGIADDFDVLDPREVSEVCLEVFEEFSDFCGGVLQVGERVED
jgi:hypothetical protein